MIATEIQLPDSTFHLIQSTLIQHPHLSFDQVVIDALHHYLNPAPHLCPNSLNQTGLPLPVSYENFSLNNLQKYSKRFTN